MSEQLEKIIRAASTPLEPISPQVAAHLPPLTGMRAVLFDIYGTLLVSGSGDIGTADPTGRGTALAAALDSVGCHFTGDAQLAIAEFRQVIDEHHERSKTNGIPFPEVDIIAVWRDTTARLHERGELAQAVAESDLAQLAVEFEVRVNPVWPMPGMAQSLAALHRRGLVMGIISNAQFFTPLVFPALLHKSLDELGFVADLRYYSFESRCAKPGLELYRMAANDLATRNIQPFEVLYVGNDMRNDIWPAAEVGFRTALFAGDERSLRLRTEETSNKAKGAADVVVTCLNQIEQILDTTGGVKVNRDGQ